MAESESSEMVSVSSDLRSRRRSASMDHERDAAAKNDDNNNVDAEEVKTNGRHYEVNSEDAAERDDRLHRMAKCPSRNTDNEGEEDENCASITSKDINSSKTSPLRILVDDEEKKQEEKTNIDSQLHINDEIINIIANSKHLLANSNSEDQPQEIVAKNERVSTAFSFKNQLTKKKQKLFHRFEKKQNCLIMANYNAVIDDA